MNTHKKKCIVCEQNLFGQPCQKLCSDSCRKKHRKVRNKRTNEKNKVERFCRQCEGSYSRVQEKMGFCSISCGSKWHIENGAFDVWRLRANEKQGIDKTCDWDECENPVYETVGHKEKYKMGRFCGNECRAKSVGKNQRGENSPRHRAADKYTEETKKRNKATLLKRYGVTNAFAFAKHRNVSKPQQALFEYLSKNLSDCHFELEKFVKVGPRGRYADIVEEGRKVVIELNGDYWHCHPARYAPGYFHPTKKKTAQEIWKSDENKIKEYEKAGYDVCTVWGSEWKESKEKVLHMIMRTINDAV